MEKSFSARLLIGLFRVLACLPLRVLYLLSDMAFVMVYYIARYRRRVVDDNLSQCFPAMTAEERNGIRRRFYRNFCDTFVEAVKLLHISDSEMCRRMKFVNTDLIDNMLAQGKSVAIYFSHCGNWEWAPSITLHTAMHKGVEYCQVYRPLRNHAFDSLMLAIRSRFGSLSFPKSTVLRDIVMLRRDGIQSVTGFMSDQKPSHNDPTVVTMFLNRPTAFISGTETLARRLELAVLYWDMEKLGRGHYRITTRLLDDGSHAGEKGTLTKKYAAMLQDTIERDPAIWLWTHKRWKIPVTLQ
ncbi:MAG: lysophospholipid acyltransferase family protein [Muribaculaceae bacterium]|nr:lysophospholipid acyltransferase family protein [Muribaculaceae bacterium]